MSIGLTSISIKRCQSILQKTITWTKKSGKGRQKWQKTCLDMDIHPHKLKILVKTRFFSKVILFQETLEFKNIIACYYG